MRLVQQTAVWVLSLSVIVLAGCGSSNARGRVKGRVKYLDKYLTCGTVSFLTKDGRSGVGTIDLEGNYEIGSAPVGEVTVTVAVPRLPAGGAKAVPKPPRGVPAMQAPGESNAKEPPPGFDPKKIVSIPAKYEKAETSPLKFAVEKGDQTYNITLSP